MNRAGLGVTSRELVDQSVVQGREAGYANLYLFREALIVASELMRRGVSRAMSYIYLELEIKLA